MTISHFVHGVNLGVRRFSRRPLARQIKPARARKGGRRILAGERGEIQLRLGV